MHPKNLAQDDDLLADMEFPEAAGDIQSPENLLKNNDELFDMNEVRVADFDDGDELINAP